MSVIALLAASPGVFIGAAVVLGLAIGSFLNVVIYRLPVMLDRQWREQCAEFTGKMRRPPRRPRSHGALQPGRAAFRLPVVQGAHHGARRTSRSSPG